MDVRVDVAHRHCPGVDRMVHVAGIRSNGDVGHGHRLALWQGACGHRRTRSRTVQLVDDADREAFAGTHAYHRRHVLLVAVQRVRVAESVARPVHAQDQFVPAEVVERLGRHVDLRRFDDGSRRQRRAADVRGRLRLGRGPCGAPGAYDKPRRNNRETERGRKSRSKRPGRHGKHFFYIACRVPCRASGPATQPGIRPSS